MLSATFLKVMGGHLIRKQTIGSPRMTSKDSLSSIPDPERTRLNFADAVARRFSAFLTDFGFLLINHRRLLSGIVKMI